MAIEIIDAATVKTDSYESLKEVMEDSSGTYAAVNYIYLVSDITIGSAGISINASRSELVLDGGNPEDPEAPPSTITDYDGSDTGNTLGVRSNSSIRLTYKNLKWVGQNRYGAFYSSNSGSTGQVMTFQNVEYSGPQIVYHLYGTTRFIGCTINIVTGYGGRTPQETAELSKLVLGGVTSIDHIDAAGSDSCFWFRESTPSIMVLSGARVTISSRTDMIYEGAKPSLILEPDARLTLTTQQGVFRSTSHAVSSVVIGAGASLTVRQTESLGSPVFNCDGPFTVEKGGSVYMEKAAGGSGELLRLSTSSAALRLNEPDSAVFYNNGAVAFQFASSTQLSLTGGQVNLWNTAAPAATAGGFDDPPHRQWKKAEGITVLTGTTTGSSTNITGNNFTAEEQQSLPPLSDLTLYSAPVFSVGSMPLSAGPFTDDGYPVEGFAYPKAQVRLTYTDDTPYEDSTAADDSGVFSFATEPVTAGVDLTLTASRPFLLAQLTGTVQEAGEIAIVSAPAEMEFTISPVSVNPVLFGRTDPTWKLLIEDTRVRSTDWTLYAAVNGDLKGYDGEGHVLHTLPEALAFVEADGTVKKLTTTPLAIYDGAAGAGRTEISWAADRGVLIVPSSNPFRLGEEYRADITWSIETDEIT